MKRYVLAGAWWLAAATIAHAQGFSGTPSANQIFAGPTSGPAAPGRFRSIVSGDIPAGTVTNSALAAATQNTVKGAATSTAVTDLTMPSCSATGSATKWTTNTGFGCQTTLADLAAAGQTLSGGATVTAANLGTVSSGTLTINCGTVPLQFFTNNGAFTLAAPASDSSCMVLMTNGASAGAVSFSGFTVGSSTGDTLTTTNTQKFTFSIWRINGVAGYRVAAHQ